MKVYLLTKEDASHLGGPMGTEYTTTLWTKAFQSVKAAKSYALQDSKWKSANWQKQGTTRLSWDVSHCIYSIEKQAVLRSGGA